MKAIDNGEESRVTTLLWPKVQKLSRSDSFGAWKLTCKLEIPFLEKVEHIFGGRNQHT